jgi:cyclopropane-fatty-acyl-phospholipid synthase
LIAAARTAIRRSKKATRSSIEMGSSQSDVEVSYDVSNEFFRLWLDERMNYTSAVYETPDQSLEAAQLNKLKILSDFAKAGPDKKVLDIGCGWGAALEYAVTSRGVKRAVGVTLSTAQSEEGAARKLPGVEIVVSDYMKFETDEKFDSVYSICMMDHLCSPEEARKGKAVDIYRAFFKHAWDQTNKGAWFGLQTILRNRTPRPSPWGALPRGERKDLEDIYFCTTDIFPGGLNPRLEEIIQAVNPWWEVVSVNTRREDYQRTTGEWLRRLRLNEKTIRSKWGDKVFVDYDRYLDTCVRAFAQHYSSLAQYELRRID